MLEVETCLCCVLTSHLYLNQQRITKYFNQFSGGKHLAVKMFSTLETEENDVFSCNICDDIFVSEDGIKKHIARNHETKDLEDSGLGKNVKMIGLNNSEKENNKIKGQDRNQPWWLEDTFHVCDVCDEMFINSPGLKNHQRLRHNVSQKNAITGEITEAQDKNDEMKLTVNTSLLNTNGSSEKKLLLLESKRSKRFNSISRKESIKPTKVQENLSTAFRRDLGGDRTSSSCFKCGLPCKSLAHRKNHILSHYYSAFHKVLPNSSPFACPQCTQISRDRITLIRHFAFAHKKMYEFTGVTEELLLLK